jgi:hypothetical protein
MFHHKKSCTGKRQRKQFPQTTASVNETDDLSTEGQLHEQVPNRGPDAEINAPKAASNIVPVAAMKRVSLLPKTKKIINFLATAERGEGCSREYAQSWLDFQHAEYGQTAHLLPKDIRTCWSHVATVLYVIILMYVTMNFELNLTIFFVQTHASLLVKRITVRTAVFNVPMDVQELMSIATATLTFKFLDPVECLIHLLSVGALSADMANIAFTPRLNHPW